MKDKSLYAVILAGGIGSRFWPLSRKSQPKQFLRFLQRLTLIQNTVRRIRYLAPLENIFVVGNKIHAYEIKKQLFRFKIPSKNILLEPKGKNTAPAIGLAAMHILSRDPNAVMLILPSDHLISKEAQFLSTLKKAKEVATSGYLVTLGVSPKSPQTGYGYIKIKNEKLKIKNLDACLPTGKTYKVERFIEKPSKERAKRFVKDRKYYWNSGIFIWKANVILKEIKKYLPSLYEKLRKIKEGGNIQKIWNSLLPISIDYGVMEKTKQAVMIPARFGWKDLGSWQALDELLPKDNLGNIFTPLEISFSYGKTKFLTGFKAKFIDFASKNITVFGDKRIIATVGLSNIIIVDTPNALLVCHKDKVQEVKRIVEELRKKGYGRQE